MSKRPAPTSLVSVEEYLLTEPFSPRKREYLLGVIHDMAGASEAHNRIASNLAGLLFMRLRGSACEHFGSDMKLRLRRMAGACFYYPDAMIACDPTDSPGQSWKERPAALFEIISPSSRRIDEREKRMSYLDLPSLQAYARIEQHRPKVSVDWRDPKGNWQRARCGGLEAVMTLPFLKIELPLAELYERLDFTV